MGKRYLCIKLAALGKLKVNFLCACLHNFCIKLAALGKLIRRAQHSVDLQFDVFLSLYKFLSCSFSPFLHFEKKQ